MRSLIITDLHEDHPQTTIERAREAGIEKVVCLGDIENPQIMKYLLDLDMKKIIVIGDHEYHHCNKLKIYSSSMSYPFSHYQNLWEQFPKEKKFVTEKGKIFLGNEEEKSGILVSETINQRKICYVHGSLLDEEPMHPGRNGIMWGRILYDHYGDKKKMNFEKMKERGLNVLFRGHDHTSNVISTSKNKDLNNSEIKMDYSSSGTIIKMKEDQCYIVSVGAFERGVCAVFDEEDFSLEYTNLGFFRKK